MVFNIRNSKLAAPLVSSAVLFALAGCGESRPARVVPALEYAHAVKEGSEEKFSFFDVAQKRQQEKEAGEKAGLGLGDQNQPIIPADARGAMRNEQFSPEQKSTETKIKQMPAQNRFEEQGFQLKKSIALPETEATRMMEAEFARAKAAAPPPPPAGSSSPYYLGQMTANASLWPDESQQSSLFRDLRAFQPMDVVTIMINESVEGQKRTQTDSQSRFSILAAVTNLFNFLAPVGEPSRWVSNNEGLDPENMINAQTNSVYQGTGQTRRLGSLRGKLSAVVLEVLPNGLLRVEGTKIISVDNEEEVMVVSGLARLRDIDPQNQLDSARIANMRIDFYGKGVAGDVTNLGWGTRLVRQIWPF